MQAIHRLYATISPWFRRRRLRWFRATLRPAPDEPILDVGGNPWFWQDSGLANPVTLLNVDFPAGLAERHPRFDFVIGDGCRLACRDEAYPIVFSNSVIEHVGSWTRQQAFAREVRRAGRRLWVQTPAREFFIEPHLIAPFIHWLPRRWQRRLVRNFTIRGWLERPRLEWIDAFLTEVRLLSLTEMQALFPDCVILRERFLGMTKSYIAVRTHP